MIDPDTLRTFDKIVLALSSVLCLASIGAFFAFVLQALIEHFGRRK